MGTEILQSLNQLAKAAGSEEEIEAVKTCLNIFKMENRKNKDLFKICAETENVIYKRSLDLKGLYSSTNNY